MSTRILFLLAGLAFGSAVGSHPVTHALAQVQIPPEVETQAQAIDEKFAATLNEECGAKLCAPVGCEIVRFRTLDRTQNSSLPGLDPEADEAPVILQYKLEAIRCEFVHEPSVTADAIASLRQRLAAKVRQAGVTVAVNGRRLNAANPAFRGTTGAEKSPLLAPPNAEQGGLARAIHESLPTAITILLGTLGAMALIWSLRRLGKPRPIEPSPEALADEAQATSEAPLASAGENAGPSAVAIITKREYLKDLLASDADLSERVLVPLVQNGEKEDLCRVLQHFGPQPLARLAQSPEHTDLFAAVRKKYETETREESNAVVGSFLDKIERLLALAQLGRQETSLDGEFSFLKDLGADEFLQLTSSLEIDELLAALSFVPAPLRAKFLQGCDDSFVDAWVQHVARHPRVPAQVVRRVARKMRDEFTARHSEIKSVTREQLPILEQVLNSMSSKKRTALLARLQAEQPALFEQLLSQSFFDRSLVALPEGALNDLFLRLTPEEGAAYLNGHPDRHAVLAKLKAPLAAAVRNQAQFALPRIGLDLDFIESETPLARQARTRLNDGIKEKAASGEINLRRLNEAALASV